MIFKQADSKKDSINTLKELLEKSNSDKQKALIQKDISLLNSGIASEQQNAYYIDFYMEKSENIIVIHDIRLEHNGRTAQIDHMLISRGGIELIESKSFKGVLTINNDGSLNVDYDDGMRSFPNPLEQSKRHADVLKSFLEDNISFGKRINLFGGLTIHSTVLIHPSTPIKNTSLPNNFFRADTYISKRIEEIEKMNFLKAVKIIARMIDIDTAKEIAVLICNSHKPLQFDYRKKYRVSESDNEVAEVSTEFISKKEDAQQSIKQLSQNDPCPFCNNPLVLRKGKDSNSFLGCSTYPKCRFIRRVSKEIL